MPTPEQIHTKSHPVQAQNSPQRTKYSRSLRPFNLFLSPPVSLKRAVFTSQANVWVIGKRWKTRYESQVWARGTNLLLPHWDVNLIGVHCVITQKICRDRISALKQKIISPVPWVWGGRQSLNFRKWETRDKGDGFYKKNHLSVHKWQAGVSWSLEEWGVSALFLS